MLDRFDWGNQIVVFQAIHMAATLINCCLSSLHPERVVLSGLHQANVLFSTTLKV
jgi:hypothetical protein